MPRKKLIKRMEPPNCPRKVEKRELLVQPEHVAADSVTIQVITGMTEPLGGPLGKRMAHGPCRTDFEQVPDPSALSPQFRFHRLPCLRPTRTTGIDEALRHCVTCVAPCRRVITDAKTQLGRRTLRVNRVRNRTLYVGRGGRGAQKSAPTLRLEHDCQPIVVGHGMTRLRPTGFAQHRLTSTLF